jgi:hypothetical protein
MTINTSDPMVRVVAIRPEQEVMTLQRLPYFVGISGSTVGSQGLSMHLVVIPPGAKADPHIHVGYETISEPGEFLFVPPGVPHEAVNLSPTSPARAVIARNDCAEQDKVIPFEPNVTG